MVQRAGLLTQQWEDARQNPLNARSRPSLLRDNIDSNIIPLLFLVMAAHQRSTSAAGAREKTYFEQQREALVGEIAMVRFNFPTEAK